MKIKTLNKTKSNDTEVVIKDEIFGIDPNEDVILRVLNWQLAKKQQGNHKVKSRSEVKSTTAKMYRQKGGGRACLLYTSPSPRDISGSRMPSSA